MRSSTTAAQAGALLAALALHLGHVVRTDALVDLLWGDRPPASVTGTLQAYVAGLRRVLEPDRAPRSAPTVLVTSGAGYVLRPSSARLLLVATWRSHPAPTGRLAEAAEALARAHALRLELQGLSAPETAELVSAVVGERLSDADAQALSRRTDGNPFFLVEYARLLAASDDPSAALASEPPPAVTDVLRAGSPAWARRRRLCCARPRCSGGCSPSTCSAP